MARNLLHVGAKITCFHAGQVTIQSTNRRVKVSGQAVATVNDSFVVTGCPFQVGPKPQPCVKLAWTMPASRVKVNGQPVILQDSTGVGQSAEQIPQGPPRVVSTQQRVSGR